MKKRLLSLALALLLCLSLLSGAALAEAEPSGEPAPEAAEPIVTDGEAEAYEEAPAPEAPEEAAPAEEVLPAPAGDGDAADAWAVHIDVEEAVSRTLTEDGSIRSDTGGVYVRTSRNGEAEVTVKGRVTAQGSGVEARAYTGGTTRVTTGNITSYSDNARPLLVEAGSNREAPARAVVSVGDVTGTPGVSLSAWDYGQIDLTTGRLSTEETNRLSVRSGALVNASFGDVFAPGGDGLDISVVKEGCPETLLDLTAGEVTASGSALHITSNAEIPVKVTTGALTAGDCGIYLAGSGIYSIGKLDAAVDGDILSGDVALMLGNPADIEVYGDITSTENMAIMTGGQNTVCDILVTGTVSGAGGGIDIPSGYPESVTLTCWRLDGGRGPLVSDDDEDGTFLKSISYIVRTEQPAEGGSFRVLKEDGTPLDRSHDLDVTHYGDRIILEPALEEGWYIAAAFNDNGAEKKALSQDEQGRWYLDVPEDGGMRLSVQLSNEYAIYFLNENGQGLQRGQHAWGETPIYEGKTPVKPADKEYTYTFAGWEPAVVPVSGNAEYTAVFERTPRALSVTLSDDGRTARVDGNAEGLYARVALVLDNGGQSGLYVTQAPINGNGVIVVPAFQVPGLLVTGVSVALVPTLTDIQSPTPEVLAFDAAFIK